MWSAGGRLLDRQTRANAQCEADGIRRLDAEGIGAWLIEALGRYRGVSVKTIIPVAHGAGVAALRQDALAFAPLDYEQPIPTDVIEAYRAKRDDFCVTGSPPLPDGLNLGAQLFWLDRLCSASAREALVLPWAQYWAWFLSGVAVSEATSLGCHSDLWAPGSARFSPMAEREGWAARFAPLAKAGDSIGTLRASLVEATGLPAGLEVLAGLHDSNAALLAARGFPGIALGEATVLSTGTWFVAMRTPDQSPITATLPEGRDCLINVDVQGRPLPSARFMGGREIETVIGLDTRRVDIKPDQPALLAAAAPVLEKGAMLLPTLVPGCGPFPASKARWLSHPNDWHERRAAACLYAALVADTSLDLIGSHDSLLVEGRFAEAEVFVRALASLRPGTRVFTASAHNDVSFGALRLVDPGLKPEGELHPVAPLGFDLDEYRSRWRAGIGAMA